MSLDPPKSTFSVDYISALGGAIAPKNFNKAMLAHTTNGDGDLPKKFKGGHLKLSMKSSRTCGAVRPQVGLCPIFLDFCFAMVA